jgi:cell fate (sporulation/competence/biofilm development) regulator YmcA (YheA/YmcA/DUF963 family)
MRILPLIYLAGSLLLIPSFAATESAPKAEVNSAEKGNQDRGPNFGKLTVTGVTKDEITAFGLAWRKANQNENVIAARERLAEARKRLQEATGAEKKEAVSAARSGMDELRIEIRKAIQLADPKLKIELIEKLMDAAEEQIKNRMQEKKNSSTPSGTKNS